MVTNWCTLGVLMHHFVIMIKNKCKRGVPLSLEQLPERMVIENEWLPIALIQEAMPFFSKYEAANKWFDDVKMIEQDINFVPSDSFQALYQCVYEKLLQGKPATKLLLQEAFVNYIDTIIYAVEPHLLKEEQEGVTNSTDVLENEQLSFNAIDAAIDNERIFTSMNSDFLFMRNTLSQSKKFVEHPDGKYVSEIVDTKGTLRGTAELRNETIEMPDSEQATLWLQLVESTLSAFDELTADLLDIISHLWILQEKDEDGYIEFHSDEVLKLQHVEPNNKPLVIRDRDRFKIMKRVAAMASIWISMRENSVKVVNKAKISAEENYDFTTFHRMFDINSVKVAYDKKTGDPKGIYALKIKPAPILRRYFDSSLQTFISLDLRIIQYSYHKQKELKRLGRYLSYQWKVRTLTRNLKQPFKVKTIVNTLDFPSSYNGVIIREKLEQILDKLQEDNIVAEWYYTEPVDESKVGKRDWVKKYWGELNLVILPSKETVEENKKKIDQIAILAQKKEVQERLPNKTLSEYEQAVSLSVGTVKPKAPLSPETVSQIIETEKLSIRAASNEIGISHSTLLRYLNKEVKRFKKENMNKLQAWYEERNTEAND